MYLKKKNNMLRFIKNQYYNNVDEINQQISKEKILRTKYFLQY